MSATIVDGTVRKPVQPWTPAVHSLLRHFESVGFDGAPRVVGVQDGVEMLSYVEGGRSYDPSDAVVAEIGRLVRRMHDAQAGFVPPRVATWQMLPDAVPGDEVVCHNDLLGANIVFQDAKPVAFIDWELASPGPRGVDLVAPAAYWVPLRPDADAARHGIPTDRRGRRLRALLDAYDYEDREGFLDLVAAVWRSWREAFRIWGGVERCDRWAEAYDTGRCEYIDGNLAWLDEHRGELGAWL